MESLLTEVAGDITLAVLDGARVEPEELREFCRARLAPFAVPKRFRIVDRLPRDAQGKLRRRELESG